MLLFDQHLNLIYKPSYSMDSEVVYINEYVEVLVPRPLHMCKNTGQSGSKAIVNVRGGEGT